MLIAAWGRTGGFQRVSKGLKSPDSGKNRGTKSPGSHAPGLDIFLYGNIYSFHGEGGDHFGCVQRGCRAAAAGHFELFGAPGTGRRRHCVQPGNGAAFGLKASGGTSPGWSGTRAAQRTAHVLPDERGGDKASA